MDVYKCQVGHLEKTIAVDSKEKEAEMEALVVKLHQKTEVAFAVNLHSYFTVCPKICGNPRIRDQNIYLVIL